MSELVGYTYPKDKSKYDLQNVIDTGSSAVVHMAVCMDNGEKVAIKCVNLRESSQTIEELLKEINITKALKHENVVSYCTSFVVENDLWLVTKYLDGGSLADIINFRMKALDCRQGVLDEINIATVLREVLKGLEYLHDCGHIHRDIKAANILIGLDGSVQIADFGISTSKEDIKNDKTSTFVGTLPWMSPEVVENIANTFTYDSKVDIWSLGITGLEAVIGKPPHFKDEPKKIILVISQNNPPTLETCEEDKDQYSTYSKAFRHMISCCLKKDPKERSSAKELLKHEFFEIAKDKEFIKKHLALPYELRNLDIKERIDVTSNKPYTRWVKTENNKWGCIEGGDSNKEPKQKEQKDNVNNNVTNEQFNQNVTNSNSNGNGSNGHNSSTNTTNNNVNGTNSNGNQHHHHHSNSNGTNSQQHHHTNSNGSITTNQHQHTPSNGNISPTGVNSFINSISNGNTPNENSNNNNNNNSSNNNNSKESEEGDNKQSNLESRRKRLGSSPSINQNQIPLVLRMRDEKKELKNIRFNFIQGKDTVELISQELVSAKLIDGKDMFTIQVYLAKLLDNPSLSPIQFQIKSGLDPNDQPDEKEFIGYAQLFYGNLPN